MNNRTTVLVVDDDPAIVDLLRDFLEAEGFGVEGALDAPTAQAIVQRTPVACVLLDVMLPGQNGFELCREWRRTSDVPILFLSARGEDIDKLRGLGLGGDDYVVKSATPSEVVARVKAVLRRAARGAPPNVALLQFGALVLDVRAREVRLDSRLIPFTPREFDLLRLLAEHPRHVFTYEQLLQHFWDDIGDRHTITVHIERIRKKIEPDPTHPRYIVNVWGVGYRFEGTAQ